MSLTYDELRAGVAGEAVGIRSRTVMEPLGGPGDKVFPPTYGAGTDPQTKYAVERRRVLSGDGGSEVKESVVLDSVASQSNRLELALLEAIRRGELAAPLTSVDFQPAGLVGLDRISDYEAPHRIFDALLRDSYDGEHLFRNAPVGRAITEARSRDAAALLHHSPHTLVFGGWDSTGPRGGLGAKYERALTSEIVALEISRGVKTGSRVDPGGIEKQAGPLYRAPDGTWTLDPDEAARDKGKPVLFGKGKEQGRPSQANHGNVLPAVDAEAGGVTARTIEATTVLSFIQLRRLRFPTRPDGSTVADEQRVQLEVTARAALAALGLAAAILAFEEGFDLRSRCVLVASGPPGFEMVARDGSAYECQLSGADALKLVGEAAERASAAGIGWRTQEQLLRPSDRLVELIRRSQAVTAAADIEDEG